MEADFFLHCKGPPVAKSLHKLGPQSDSIWPCSKRQTQKIYQFHRFLVLSVLWKLIPEVICGSYSTFNKNSFGIILTDSLETSLLKGLPQDRSLNEGGTTNIIVFLTGIIHLPNCLLNLLTILLCWHELLDHFLLELFWVSLL